MTHQSLIRTALVVIASFALCTPQSRAEDTYPLRVAGYVDDQSLAYLPADYQRMLLAGTVSITQSQLTLMATTSSVEQEANKVAAILHENPVLECIFAYDQPSQRFFTQTLIQRKPVLRVLQLPIEERAWLTRQPKSPIATLYRARQQEPGGRIAQDFFIHRLCDGALFQDRAQLVQFGIQSTWASTGVPSNGGTIPMSNRGSWSPSANAGNAGNRGWVGSAGSTIVIQGNTPMTLVGYTSIVDGNGDGQPDHADNWYLDYIGDPVAVLSALPSDPQMMDFDGNGSIGPEDIQDAQWFDPSLAWLTTTNRGGWIVVTIDGTPRFLSEYEPGTALTWTHQASQLPHDYNLFAGMDRVFAGLDFQLGESEIRVAYQRSQEEGMIVLIAPIASLKGASEVPAWVSSAMGVDPASDNLRKRLDEALAKVIARPTPGRTSVTPALHDATGQRIVTDESVRYDLIVAETELSAVGGRTDQETLRGKAVAADTKELQKEGLSDPFKPQQNADVKRVLNDWNPRDQAEREALELEKIVGLVQEAGTPVTRPDYGTWEPGNPVVRTDRSTGMAGAFVETANAVARFMEGGQMMARNRGDYKKALILPAGVMPRDVVPPWSIASPPDPLAADFAGRGDGDNPLIPHPGAIWPVCGLPFYDHDGDGDLDRFWSSDPYGNGYTHIRIRWQFMKVTMTVRTGMSTTYQAMGANMGFKSFSPVNGSGDMYKAAAFSVAGLILRPDGVIKSEEILFWGNDTAFKEDEKKKKTNRAMLGGIVAGAVIVAAIAVGCFTFGIGTVLILIAAAAAIGSTVPGWTQGTDREYYYGPSLCNFLVKADPGTSLEQLTENDPRYNPTGSSTWIFRLVYTGSLQPIQTTSPQDIHVTPNAPVRRVYYRTTDQEVDPQTNVIIPGKSTETNPDASTVVRNTEGAPQIDHVESESSQTFENGDVDPATLNNAATDGNIYSRAGFIPLTTANPPLFITTYHRTSEIWNNGVPPDRNSGVIDGSFLDYDAIYPRYLMQQSGMFERPDGRLESNYYFMLSTVNEDTTAADGAPLYDSKGLPIIDTDGDGNPDNADGVVDTQRGRYIDIDTGNPIPDFVPYSIDFNEDGIIDARDEAYRVRGVHPKYPTSFVIVEPVVSSSTGVTDYRLVRRVRYEDDPSRAQPPMEEAIEPPPGNQDSWGWGVHDLIPRGTPNFSEGQSIARRSWELSGLSSIYETMTQELTAVHDTLQKDAVEAAEISGDIMAAGAVVSAILGIIALAAGLVTVAGGLGLGLAAALAPFAATAGAFTAAAAAVAVIVIVLAAAALIVTVAINAYTGMDKSPISQGDISRVPWFDKEYGWKNGGGVILNGSAPYEDSGVARALGIGGELPLVTTVGASLKRDSGGLIELIVHDDPSLVRPEKVGTEHYWMGQATQYRHYDRGSFPAALDYDRVIGADIRPSPYGNRDGDINFSGDRVYRVDSGFGWYTYQGQILRFYNEIQQAMILRQKWAYDFMTPPTRMVRQFWNNNDPNSPLLNEIRPKRYDATPDQSNATADHVALNDIQGKLSASTGTVSDFVGSDAAATWAPDTKAMMAMDVFERRKYLRDNSYYMFSAFRGREWEVEMAKRMPKQVKLICVEWEDRELVRDQFAALGLKVEFAENRKDKDEVEAAVNGNSAKNDLAGLTAGIVGAEGRSEIQIYNEIADRYFDVNPAPLLKFDDRIASFERNKDAPVAKTINTVRSLLEMEKNENLESGSQTSDTNSKSAKKNNRFPFIASMPDGKPAVFIDRSDRTEEYKINTDSGDRVIPFTKVWTAEDPTRDGRIFYLLYGKTVDAKRSKLVSLAPTEDTSIAVRKDLVEFRHPMLVYYNDATSAIYVQYGVNCNPKDVFGRWSEHEAGRMNADLDPEFVRRTKFEQQRATNSCTLQNIYAELYPEAYARYQDYLKHRNPPPRPEDPGAEPLAKIRPGYDGPTQPVRPVLPATPIEPNCRLPKIMTNEEIKGFAGLNVLDRATDYRSRLSFVTEGPGFAAIDASVNTLILEQQQLRNDLSNPYVQVPPDAQLQKANRIIEIENTLKANPAANCWEYNVNLSPALQTKVNSGQTFTASEYYAGANASCNLWRPAASGGMTPVDGFIDGIVMPAPTADITSWESYTNLNTSGQNIANRQPWRRYTYHPRTYVPGSRPGAGYWRPASWSWDVTSVPMGSLPYLVYLPSSASSYLVTNATYRTTFTWNNPTGATTLTTAVGGTLSNFILWNDTTNTQVLQFAPGNTGWTTTSVNLTNGTNYHVDFTTGPAVPSSLYVAIGGTPSYKFEPATKTVTELLGPGVIGTSVANLGGPAASVIRENPGGFTYTDMTPYVTITCTKTTRVWLDVKGRGTEVSYVRPDGTRTWLSAGHNMGETLYVDHNGGWPNAGRFMTPYAEVRWVINLDTPGTYTFYARPALLEYDWIDYCDNGLTSPSLLAPYGIGGGSSGGCDSECDATFTYVCGFSGGWKPKPKYCCRCIQRSPKVRHYRDDTAYVRLLRVQQEPLYEHCLQAWLAYERDLAIHNDYWSRGLPDFERMYANWTDAVQRYNQRSDEWFQDQGTLAQRYADWLTKSEAYNRWVIAVDEWRQLKEDADAFLRNRDIWMENVRTEASLAGVLWSNAQLQPTPLSVTTINAMPSTSIWQAYKYIIAEPDPNDGTIPIGIIRGSGDERRRKLDAFELGMCR